MLKSIGPGLKSSRFSSEARDFLGRAPTLGTGIEVDSIKIFISFLIRGMEVERAAVREAITTLGHEAILAESFYAQDASRQVACLKGVQQSELFLLIRGDRYGATQASGLSATHEEFEEARNTKPVLAFHRETGV